ncbi:cobalamin-binding protein [Lacipirellula sp.]|uniref:cobalamin-binding protein n=1 Tax=Lacipirellula sp. TaxID=2691419 RepID=UPI003D11DB28
MPRIVSLLPAATEMICGIGLREQLVGVSHECNYPHGLEGLPRLTRSRIDSSADSAAIDAQVKALAATGESFYEVDADRLAALRPDLIVTQGECCDVCAVSLSSVERIVAERKELRETQVVALNPESLDEVLADIERIGAAAGATVVAEQYVLSLRERIADVRAAVEASTVPSARRPRVAVIEWIEPLMTAGNWTPELVELAGGNYGLAEAGRHSPYVEWRQIVEFAPEVLVIAPCGFDLERSRQEAACLEQLPGWAEVPAVAQGRATVIDGDAYLNRPGPRLIESLELLRRLIAAAD